MKDKFFNSIKFKITSLLLGSITVIFLVSFIILFSSRKIMTEYIAEKNTSISNELLDKIDIFIYNYINDLVDISYQQGILEKVMESNKNLENVENIDEILKEKSTLWVKDDTLYNDLLENRISQYLKNVFKENDIKEHGYQIFGEVFITNKFGEIIATNNKTTNYIQKDEPWWNLAIEQNIYYSNIVYDKSSSTYGIDIAVSLKYDNENIGVIKGILDISKVIEEAKIGWDPQNKLNINLFTSDGKIINSSKLYKFLDDYSSESFFPKNKDDLSGFYLSKDDEMLYSFSRSSGYRNYNGLDWLLIISESLDDALEPIERFSKTIYILLGLIIILGALATLFIVVSIIRPIKDFEKGTKIISEGDLSYTFKVTKNIELIQLSDSFNIMMEKLQLSYDKIKRKEHDARYLSKKLISSNQELEQFAYIASHDLKEPLRKITAYGGLLSEEYASGLDEQGQKYIAVMEKAARRMDDLLTNLLAYSRVENRGKEFLKFNIGYVLQEVLSDIEIQIHETQSIINSSELPDIHGDSVQIAQVLQNIISNSIKFVKPGVKPIIDISCTSNKEENKHIIKISDNGIGFDLKFKDEIFKPFKKLHAASVYAGTGIGLAICKKIIHRHNGEIQVESKEGSGTTFYISLPMIKKEGKDRE